MVGGFSIGFTHKAMVSETPKMILNKGIVNTVEPLYSGHHWFSDMVSAIEKCPL